MEEKDVEFYFEGRGSLGFGGVAVCDDFCVIWPSRNFGACVVEQLFQEVLSSNLMM